MITDVNRLFRTTFAEFEPNRENVRAVMEEMDRWDRNVLGSGQLLERGRAQPTAARDLLKEELRSRYFVPRLAPLRQRAERLHSALVGSSR